MAHFVKMARASSCKGKGGNAHDRAKARVASQPASELGSLLSNAYVQVSPRERVLRLVDNSSTQTLVGIVGGLVGTFLDGRYFAVLSLMVSFALYRSKALDGVRSRLILPIYISSLMISGWVLFCMGIQVNKSRPHTFTPADYLDAIKNHTQLPITQQITNVYNSFISPQKTIGEPRIDAAGIIGDASNPVDARGMHWHINAINNGTAPALDVISTEHSFVAAKSKSSEDELFKFIEDHAYDSDAPRYDLPPGPQYSEFEPIVVAIPSEQEKVDLQAGTKVLYMGHLNSYRDAEGHRFQSEVCMYMMPRENRLLYCDGHNKTRRLGNG